MSLLSTLNAAASKNVTEAFLKTAVNAVNEFNGAKLEMGHKGFIITGPGVHLEAKTAPALLTELGRYAGFNWDRTELRYIYFY